MKNETLFYAKGLSKSYDNTKALQNIDFSVNNGEIVGIVGENGAGKSTFLKIAIGVEHPDKGEMYMNGKVYAPKSAKEANALGVGMVFQEQSLLVNLTVAQNMFFGEESKYEKAGLINWNKMEKDARQILDDLDLKDIPVHKRISDIQFSRRQMVEVAKVLVRVNSQESTSLILLDEPTSVLNNDEVQTLFTEMKLLKEAGNGVLFISHRLDEILEICDRIYVFKDGKNVCDLDKKDADARLLYKKMVGKNSSNEFYKVNRQCKPDLSKVLIEAKNIGKFGFCKGINLTLHAGEVIGLCGVVGSGKESVCSILSGDEKHTSGALKVNGKEVSFKSPNQALKEGICCIPTERRVEGEVSIAAIKDNIAYGCMSAISKMGLISKKKQNKLANKWIKDLNIRCVDCDQAIENLSGGNAQKVVFARTLSSNANIVILNHPTRGVDVGAKEEIYDIIRTATEKGIGVILLADTLEESIGLSNVIIVMKDGLVTKVFDASPDNKPTQIDIVQYMM